MEIQDLLQYHLDNGWHIAKRYSEYNFDLNKSCCATKNIREEDQDKGTLLIKLSKKFNLKSGAEIGASPGGTAEAVLAKASFQPFIMVERCPVKTLWGILLRSDNPSLKDGWVQKPWVLMRMNTEEAHKIIADKSLGFVYIDCQHKYEDVKNDIINWRKKVKPGGVLAGHDYNFASDPSRGGVAKAVDEFYPSASLEIDSDSKNCSWWLTI